MRYNIYQGGIKINTIVSDAAFVSDYCAENGYTYEEAPFHQDLEPTPEPVPEPPETITLEEMAEAVRGGINEV